MERPDPAAVLPTADFFTVRSERAEGVAPRIAELFRRLEAMRPDRRPPLSRCFSERYRAAFPAAAKPEAAEDDAFGSPAAEKAAKTQEDAGREDAGLTADEERMTLRGALGFDIEIPEPLFEENDEETAERRRRLALPLATIGVALAALAASAGVVALGEADDAADLAPEQTPVWEESFDRSPAGPGAADDAPDPFEAAALWPESDRGEISWLQEPGEELGEETDREPGWASAPDAELEAREDLEEMQASALAGYDPVDLGEIATATIAPAPPPARAPEDDALDAATVRRLLEERPVKCVIATPAGAGEADIEALRLAVSVGQECVETTEYDLKDSMLRRVAAAPEGGRIEINAAFSVAPEGLCHQTEGLSALVVGEEMLTARARSLETLLAASYAALDGAPICHRWSPIGPTKAGTIYRSEAYVNGAYSEERTDPRPFILKKSAPHLPR